MTESNAIRFLVPRPVRVLALRVAVARRLAPAAHLQLFTLGRHDKAVLTRMPHVLRLDEHSARRDGRHGLAGAVIEELDAVLSGRFIDGRNQPDYRRVLRG